MPRLCHRALPSRLWGSLPLLPWAQAAQRWLQRQQGMLRLRLVTKVPPTWRSLSRRETSCHLIEQSCVEVGCLAPSC